MKKQAEKNKEKENYTTIKERETNFKLIRRKAKEKQQEKI